MILPEHIAWMIHAAIVAMATADEEYAASRFLVGDNEEGD